MIKIFFYILLMLFPITTNAISLQELRDNPTRFKYIYADNRGDGYVDISSINVIRYAPPYYVINSSLYLVDYSKSAIAQINSTYFYDYSQNVTSTLEKSKNKEEFTNSILKYAGVKHKINSMPTYDFSGNVLSTTPYSGNITTPALLSPAYTAAMFSFYNSYKEYFNPPDKHQKF
mgnify:FL=1